MKITKHNTNTIAHNIFTLIVKGVEYKAAFNQVLSQYTFNENTRWNVWVKVEELLNNALN